MGDWLARILGRIWKVIGTEPMFFALLLTSGFSTMVGLIQYASSETGSIDWFGLIFVTLFALLIVGLVPYLMGKILKRRSSWASRMINGLLYAWVFAISVCFAFAFWWDIIESSQVTRDLALDEYNKSDAALRQATTSISLSTRSLDEISAEFTRRAATEQSVGGTCGIPSGADYGPLTQLRRNQADQFGAWARQLRASADDIGITVTTPAQTLEEAADQPEVDAASGFDETRQKIETAFESGTTSETRARLIEEVQAKLRGDALNINQLRNTVLGPRAQDFRRLADQFQMENGFDNPLSPGERITCLDSSAPGNLTSAAEQLEAVEEIARPTIPNFDGGKGIEEAVSRLLNLFGLGWLIGAPEESQLSQSDSFPIVVAFLIDIVLLFSGISRTRESQRRELLEHAQERADEERRAGAAEKLGAEWRAQQLGALDLLIRTRLGGYLHEVLVEDRGRQYFVLPSALPSGYQADIAAMRDFLVIASQEKEKSPLLRLSSPKFGWSRWLAFSNKKAGQLLQQRRHEVGSHSGIPWHLGTNFSWYEVDRRYPHILSTILQQWDLYQFSGGTSSGNNGSGGPTDTTGGSGGLNGPNAPGSGPSGSSQSANAGSTASAQPAGGVSADSSGRKGEPTTNESEREAIRRQQVEEYEANRLAIQQQFLRLDALKTANESKFASLEAEAQAALEEAEAEERIHEIRDQELRTRAANEVRKQEQEMMKSALEDPNLDLNALRQISAERKRRKSGGGRSPLRESWLSRMRSKVRSLF